MEVVRGEPDAGTFFLLILSISLAAFMSALDATIVNIALPTISESFGISSSAVSWVATAYLLVMAGCVPIFGKVSDVIGFKRVFLWGFVIFTIGSFFCGFLPVILNSFAALVGSRVFQAVGGAIITAIAPAMVTTYIPMEKKGKAMAIIVTIAALGTAIGPSLGGVLTQFISWHWIFFINVPVGIVAVLLGLRVIPATGVSRGPAGFDRYGAALVFSGLATLLFAMSEGDTLGWTSPVIIGTLVIAVITLGGFVWNELRTDDPLLNLNLFKNRNFLFTNLIMALVFFSFSGINYLLPFYLRYVKGFDTFTAGLLLTSLSFAMMGAGALSGMLYNRTGGRSLCIAAAVVLAAGYSLMTLLKVETTAVFLVSVLILIGFGLGLIISPLSNMIMNSVPKKFQGMISSLLSLERFAPMTIGIALFNIVFIQGILTIASRHGVTEEAPVNIRMQVLAAGFDLTFLVTFIIGIIILVLTVVARQETDPDYLAGEQGGEPIAGMI